MVNFSPAVRNMREERLAFQGAFKSELFKGICFYFVASPEPALPPDVGTVYVSGECRAPRDELRQLIVSGGQLQIRFYSSVKYHLLVILQAARWSTLRAWRAWWSASSGTAATTLGKQPV
jgi:hypothetical protein